MKETIYLQIVLLTALILIPLIKEKEFRLYNPVLLISIIYFLQFVLPTFYMLVNPDIFGIYTSEDFRSIFNGLNFCILVYIFFLFGFYSPHYNENFKRLVVGFVKSVPNISNFTIQIKNLPLVLIILLILGWVSRIIILKAGVYLHTESNQNFVPPPGFHIYGNFLFVGSMFPMIAYSLAFINWLNNENKKWYLFFSLLLAFLDILYAIPSSFKEKILMPLIIIMFLYSLKKNIHIIFIILFIIFTVFFVFPFTGIHRKFILSGVTSVDIYRVYLEYLRFFSNFDMVSFNYLLYTILGQRLNSALVVMTIVENTPQIWFFKLGYTYFLFFISLIPRIIWFGKPSITGYFNEFGRDYGFLYPVDYVTSIDITWVGEMFLNFGWFGIIIGFLYGLFYQIIYSYFFSNNRVTMLSSILYAFTLYYMIRGEVFSVMFSGLFKLIIGLLIVVYPFLKRVKT